MADLPFRKFWLMIHENAADGQKLHISITPREAKRAKARGLIRPVGYVENPGKINTYLLTQHGIEEYRRIFKGSPPFNDPTFDPEVATRGVNLAHLD